MRYGQKSGALLGLAAVTLVGCVHTSVERTGRLRLGDGREGLVPILASVDSNYEQAAVVTVDADAVTTVERRERHLRRRASLLGCDALIAVEHVSDDTSRGVCVRNREPDAAPPVPGTLVAVSTPESLRARALESGAHGQALLRVLERADARTGAERAWPLRWYLANYPDSPFRADVEALLVEVPEGTSATQVAAERGGPGGPASSVRNAPQGK